MEGTWQNDTCTVIQVYRNATRCSCPLPGHFTLIAIPKNETEVFEDTYTSFPLIISCVASLTFLIPAAALYLLTWRLLIQERQAIHFNLILAVICINVICLKCLLDIESENMSEVVCVINRLLLQLFTLASFTFLLLDAIHMLFVVYSGNSEDMDSGIFKFLCIGWGVPILSVMFVTMMMSLVGYDSYCSTW